ncbi:MAG TPA: hypothetical protein VJY62_00285 [Bacteroidia bacterium]|nr:hypothetical protein [Bacteroidia bacterium]
MKTAKRILTSVLIITLTAILFSFDLPAGWFKAGSKPKSYDMGVDKGAGEDGKNAATIKSIDEKIDGFGTLMQSCLPGKYLGKKIRMSGYVKSKAVDDKAGLWLRVDQANSQKPLSFDNMYDRPIKGTTDWKKYEIVLDVPLNSSKIAYGALLVGTGQIWFDNLNFEVVDNTVPATKDVKDNYTPDKEPVNLDFEK